LSLATLGAFALRLVQLDTPVLRWDEGWSIAHASLSWGSLLQVASEDWHPPAYTILLKLWRFTGVSTFAVRYFSVLTGTLAVPLAYQVGTLWSGRRRVGLFVALFAAVSPLLVYYGQVTRMYSLAALFVLAAAYCLLRGDEKHPSLRQDAGLSLTTFGAMATLYHTLWPLAGLYLYGVISGPRRRWRLVAAGLAANVLYLPWLVYAGETIRARLSTGPAAGRDPIAGTIGYLRPALSGLAFTYGSGWIAAAALVGILVLGLVIRPPTWSDRRKLWLPWLVIGISVVGVAYGSQASYWFAVRHLVPASLFLGMALAWSLDALATRRRLLLPLALAGLAIAYWPTSSRFVYAKTLEVVDPFDPMADYRFLADHAAPGDLVYFNVLSKAGWYENLRQSGDPPWSYAMRWDPIIEPMPRLEARISQDAISHHRLWFVLYQGTYGSNAPLKTWLDRTFYPSGGDWQGDTLFLAYAVPGNAWIDVPRDDWFGQVIHLQKVRLTSEVIQGSTLALELQWEASEPPTADYKVFVHLTDDSGRPLAQHDGVPGSGEQPTTTWPPGQQVLDRHGLFLPSRLPERVRVLIGLYDPATGQRLRLPDGRSFVEIATLDVPSQSTR